MFAAFARRDVLLHAITEQQQADLVIVAIRRQRQQRGQDLVDPQTGGIDGDRVGETIDRTHVALAQTPQVFRFDLLKRAFESARRDGFTGTDESSLVERLDEVEVSVVQGSDRNIKITKPTDMELARLFLSEEVTGETA